MRAPCRRVQNTCERERRPRRGGRHFLELSCILKLAEDKHDAPPHRVSEIALVVEGRSWNGRWSLVKSSQDSRLAVGASSGLWAVHHDPATDRPTLFVVRPDDQYILFSLIGVSRGALGEVGCFSSIGGDGVHEYPPPRAEVTFGISFSCV